MYSFIKCTQWTPTTGIGMLHVQSHLTHPAIPPEELIVVLQLRKWDLEISSNLPKVTQQISNIGNWIQVYLNESLGFTSEGKSCSRSHLFICLLAICASWSEKHLFKSFAHFTIWLFVLLLLNCRTQYFLSLNNWDSCVIFQILKRSTYFRGGFESESIEWIEIMQISSWNMAS